MRVIGLLFFITLCSCSSLPELQKPLVLNTTPNSQNYYYCEHCPETSKLDNQIYQALEPDEAVIEVKPIIASEPSVTIKRSPQYVKTTKPTLHHKKAHYKLKQSQTKQCITWSK